MPARLKPVDSLSIHSQAQIPDAATGKGLTVAQIARRLTPQVFERLRFWLNQDKSPSASIEAAKIILDRAYGKAVQPIADGSNHEALELDLAHVTSSELVSYERVLVKLLRKTRTITDAPVPDSGATAVSRDNEPIASVSLTPGGPVSTSTDEGLTDPPPGMEAPAERPG